MLKCYFIDLAAITPATTAADHDQTALNDAANQIIALGGLVYPLHLTQTGFNEFGEPQFTIAEGELYYHAARIAQERDRREFSTVNAFIIPATAKIAPNTPAPAPAPTTTPTPPAPTTAASTVCDLLNNAPLEVLVQMYTPLGKRVTNLLRNVVDARHTIRYTNVTTLCNVRGVGRVTAEKLLAITV